jgi:hypothetical protein
MSCDKRAAKTISAIIAALPDDGHLGPVNTEDSSAIAYAVLGQGIPFRRTFVRCYRSIATLPLVCHSEREDIMNHGVLKVAAVRNREAHLLLTDSTSFSVTAG